MWFNIPIFTDGHNLDLEFSEGIVHTWHEVTAIADGSTQDHKLFGVEFLLYEADVPIGEMTEQFQGYANIELNEHGLLYVKLREEPNSHTGFGFGRIAQLGLDERMRLCRAYLSWDSPGAGTPQVDWHYALEGLPYKVYNTSGPL